VAGNPAAEGITNPPIDDLLQVVDSKYRLVIMAAKRARQINAYYAQLGEGLLEYVGSLVETRVQEKPLSIALREIRQGTLRQGAAEPTSDHPVSRGGDDVPSASFSVSVGVSRPTKPASC
jgi:DNA-directed RNA polymerase subunit omega